MIILTWLSGFLARNQSLGNLYYGRVHQRQKLCYVAKTTFKRWKAEIGMLFERNKNLDILLK